MEYSQTKSKILLVDDDLTFLSATELSLGAHYEILKANTVALGQEVLAKQKIDVLVTDLNFGGQPKDGLFLIDWSAQEHPNVPILVLSGDSTTQRVVAATQRKGIEFVPKFGNHDQNLRLAIESALVRRKLLLSLKTNPNRFKTRCPSILRTLDDIDRLSLKNTSMSFLITGETGTGKEFMAKHLGAVFKKPVLAANMSNFGEENAESELFGHMKGSFTGAHSDKIGLIEQAHGKIFFLDELGDCTMSVQAKLLRVLETKELRRKGAVVSKKIDVQFIGATNKNLDAMMASGQFRPDLYERMSSYLVHIPPLRERPEDIEFYLNTFLVEFAKIDTYKLTPDGLEAALNYAWPGNCRELWKFTEKTVLTYPKKFIDAGAVEAWTKSRGRASIAPSEGEPISDREQLIKALNQAGGNRTDAAHILGVDPSTLFRRIKRYGLSTLFSGRPGRPSRGQAKL